MTVVYAVANDVETVRQSILDTVGVAMDSLGDAIDLRDLTPDAKIFVICIQEHDVRL